MEARSIMGISENNDKNMHPPVKDDGSVLIVLLYKGHWNS